MGTPELARYNIEREQADAGLSPLEKRRKWLAPHYRCKKSAETPEEKRERVNAYQRKRYAEKKRQGQT